MVVTREGAFPQEEREWLPETSYYCYSETLLRDVISFFNLASDAQIVDLAAGVGAMAHDFFNLLPKAKIIGIDPFVPMGPPATVFQDRLSSADFHRLRATAEATGVDDATVDLVTCGQGFSLLKFIETRNEVRRILKPSRGAAFFFIHGANRAYSGLEEFIFEIPLPEPPTQFMREFWALIKHHFRLPLDQRRELHELDQKDPETTAYGQIMRTTRVMKSLFHKGQCHVKTVAELWGHYSFTDVYTLCRWTQDEEDNAKQDENRQHREFMLMRERRIQEGLRAIFNKHQVDGRVPFYHYVTVFYGLVSEPCLD